MGENCSPYSPPLCVWEIIEESVGSEKIPIIRSLIGESTIDFANDLRVELNMLLEIWSDMNSTRILDFHPTSGISRLPEPPNQRELLIRGIQLLIQNLKENQDNDLGEALPSDCSEEIIHYAQHVTRDHHGPQTTATTAVPISRNPYCFALDNQEIGLVAKNMEILDIDTPIDILKKFLQYECDLLTEDIEYIRKCVEEGSTAPNIEPSLAELKEERKKLESYLMKSIEISPSGSRENTLIGIKRQPTPVPKKILSPVMSSSAGSLSNSAKDTLQHDTLTSDNSQYHLSSKEVTAQLSGKSHDFPNSSCRKSYADINSVPGTYIPNAIEKNCASSQGGCSAVQSFSSNRLNSFSSGDSPDSDNISQSLGQSRRPTGSLNHPSERNLSKTGKAANTFTVHTHNLENTSDVCTVRNEITSSSVQFPKPPSVKKPQVIKNGTKYRRVKVSSLQQT